MVFVHSVPHAHHPRHHYRLAAALAGAGWDVMTLSPADIEPGHVDAVPVRHLPPRRSRPMRMASGPLSVLAAARLRPRAVHVVSLDLLPWAALLRLTGRCRVLYDSNEEYDSLMLVKAWLPRPLRPVIGRAVGWAEPWLAGRLDAATTALPATHARFTARGVRSVLVRNFPLPSNAPAGGAGEPAIDVLVGGSLPEDQVPLLVATAARLAADGRRLRWLVAARSYGPREIAALEDALTRGGVRDAFELRYNVPFSRMGELMAASALGLVIYPAHENYGARIPLRVFDYLAAGLPFVASDLPTTADYVAGEGVGELVAAGDPEAYAAAIARLLDDPQRLEQMRARGPQLVREQLSWAIESRKLIALYEDLLGPPPGSRG